MNFLSKRIRSILGQDIRNAAEASRILARRLSPDDVPEMLTVDDGAVLVGCTNLTNVAGGHIGGGSVLLNCKFRNAGTVLDIGKNCVLSDVTIGGSCRIEDGTVLINSAVLEACRLSGLFYRSFLNEATVLTDAVVGWSNVSTRGVGPGATILHSTVTKLTAGPGLLIMNRPPEDLEAYRMHDTNTARISVDAPIVAGSGLTIIGPISSTGTSELRAGNDVRLINMAKGLPASATVWIYGKVRLGSGCTVIRSQRLPGSNQMPGPRCRKPRTMSVPANTTVYLTTSTLSANDNAELTVRSGDDVII